MSAIEIRGLDACLNNLTLHLSKDLDENPRRGQTQEARANIFANTINLGRLEGIALPNAATFSASSKSQLVEVRLTLRLISDLPPRFDASDPRAVVMRSLSLDLAAAVPENTSVDEHLIVGVAVFRSFPASVSIDTVRTWAAEMVAILGSLGQAAVERIDQHRHAVEGLVEQYHASKAKADELASSIGDLKFA